MPVPLNRKQSYDCLIIIVSDLKVPVPLRLRSLHDCLNINLGVISLTPIYGVKEMTPICKLKKHRQDEKHFTNFAYAVTVVLINL